jgi:hypothetical protein
MTKPVMIIPMIVSFVLFEVSSQTPERVYSESFGILRAGGTVEEAFAGERKCGFALLTEIDRLWDMLGVQQQYAVSEFLQQPITHRSILSPTGYFRIHYDTTGIHAPDMTDTGGNGVPDYIDSVASVFEFVYRYHTENLGFDSPYRYGSETDRAGEVIRYNLYVRDLRFSGIYGMTVPYGSRINDASDPAPRYDTYILIDKSYSGYPSEGIDGLRVTAAHEFHHAIQLGAYGDWRQMNQRGPALFFYEITSTWLEDVLYPEVNDYYYYLPALFSRDLYLYPFYYSSGLQMYARGIWGHMMERRYDRAIMRRIWELMRRLHPLDAIDEALRERGSTLEQELTVFNTWKFYTGSRAKPDRYFIDGAEYPMLKEKSVVQHIGGQTMFQGFGAESQTLHFHSVVSDNDTIFFLVSNVDAEVNMTDHYYEVYVYSQPQTGSIPIGNGKWYRVSTDNPSTWKIVPVYAQQLVVDERVTIYPNPFRTAAASSLSFVIPQTETETRLSVFTSDMRRVFHERLTPRNEFGRTVIRWDGRDERNAPVASGVYIYILQIGDSIQKGTFTVIRE